MSEQYLDRMISSRLSEANAKEREGHVSSGKLTASMLGNPLQWQILKVLGVPDLDPEPYTLRKFLRGNHVEDWLVGEMEAAGCVRGKQVPVEYRGVVGFVDAMVDTTAWDIPVGVIPHEIKSITSKDFAWKKKSREANEGHKLQATLYGLATGSDYYAIDYVSSDDYRTLDLPPYKTADLADEVNGIIDAFEAALESQQLPLFQERYSWQKNPIYAKYQEFILLDQEEAEKLLLKRYPNAYKKLKGIT